MGRSKSAIRPWARTALALGGLAAAGAGLCATGRAPLELAPYGKILAEAAVILGLLGALLAAAAAIELRLAELRRTLADLDEALRRAGETRDAEPGFRSRPRRARGRSNGIS